MKAMSKRPARCPREVLTTVFLFAILVFMATGCADDFSLPDATLAPGVRVVKPEGWILSLHPEGGYELLSTRSARVRKIGLHVFPQAEIAAAAGDEDPESEAFAEAVVERYRERVRAAMKKRRGFPASLVGYFDEYDDLRCESLDDRGHPWSVCRLRRSDSGHPSWYTLFIVHAGKVILVNAFAARNADGEEELSEPELRAILAPIVWNPIES